MKIAVCSTSRLKIGAVTVACARIRSVKSPVDILSIAGSDVGVPPQPYGDAQTLAGAFHRASQVDQ